MIYVGIDPSYSRTGIAYLDTEKKELVFNIASPPGRNEDYYSAVSRSAYISYSILSSLSKCQDIKMIFEEPLVTSQMSSRLGILSGVLATTFLLIPSIIEIYTIGPNAVASMNKAIDGAHLIEKKQRSLSVVSQWLEIFEEFGFTITITPTAFTKKGLPKKRNLTHDEAEALLVLIQLLKKENIFSKELWFELTKIHKGLLKNYQVNPLKLLKEIN